VNVMIWEDILVKLKSERPDLFNTYVALEEYHWPFRDKHGRFLARYSKRITYKCEVSEWLFERGFLDIEWPNKASFAVVLTHDVDFLHAAKFSAFKATVKALRQRFFTEAGRRIAAMFIKKLDPLKNIKSIISTEAQFNVKSTFFFLVNKRDFGGGNDPEELADEIGFIIDKGWEIGLHTGYFSYNDPLKISSEKKILEKISGIRVRGVRNHYLRFSTPRTWEVLSQFFDYDSTYGYDDHVGFRNGMCHPFKPSTLDGKIIDILEIPLTVMDATFYNRDGDAYEAFKWIEILVKEVKKVKGVITVLWHNLAFDEFMFSDYAKLYRALLRHFKEQGAWITNCGDLYDYWVERFK